MRPIDAIIRLRDQFTPVLRDVNRQIQQHSAAQVRFGKEIEKVGNAMSGFSKKAAMMAAPLMAAAAAGLKLNSELTNGMAKVSTLVDTNVIDMKRLRKEIVNLSNDTGVAATDLAEAQYQAISGGVEAANSVAFLGVAAKTAKAGFTDTATAIDGLTTVINAYGLANEDAMRISDQMMVAQNFGKTTINQMAGSLGNVIPLAAQLNVKTEELFAALATLTRNGIKTDEAITGLKSTFSNIIDPSEKAAAAADALGIKFSAGALQEQGLQKFLVGIRQGLEQSAPAYARLIDQHEKLRQSMQGLKKGTDEYKALNKQSKEIEKQMEIMAKTADSPIAKYAALFGNIRALNSVLVLTGKGSDDFAKAIELMDNSAGTTEEAYLKLRTPSEETKIALNQLANAGMELADGLTPLMKTGTLLMKEFAKWLNSLTEEQKTFLTYSARNIVIFVILTGAIGKAISTVGRAVSAFGKLSGGIKEAGSVAKYLRKEYGLTAKAFDLLRGGIGKLAGVMKTGFLRGLSAAKIFGNGLVAVFKFMIMGFKEFVQLIGFIGKILGKNLLTVFRLIGVAAKGLLMNPIGLAIMGIVAVAWLLYRNWNSIKEALMPTFIQIVNGVKQVFNGVIQFVTGVFTGNWSKAWDGVKNIFGGAFSALAGICKMQLNIVIALINAAIGEINNINFTAPDWVPVVGGKSFQSNIPKIPMLYKGTENWRGGTAMIHDRGAEIVDLPRGARVYPHDRSMQMMKQEGVNQGQQNIIRMLHGLNISGREKVKNYINVAGNHAKGLVNRSVLGTSTPKEAKLIDLRSPRELTQSKIQQQNTKRNNLNPTNAKQQALINIEKIVINDKADGDDFLRKLEMMLKKAAINQA